MHRTMYVWLMLVLATTFTFSQDHSKVDVFGGYSYLNIDTNDLGSRQSANGWEAAVSANMNRWLAAEFDVSGYYKTYGIDLSPLNLGTLDVKVHDYAYVAGPRVNLKPIFIHALLGGDHLTGSALGFSRSQDSFAGAFGGGVQWKVAGPWSIRASADYVFTRHNIFGGPSFTQNNVRAGAGIVYSFGGGSHASSSGTSNTPASSSQRRASMPIPSLGIMASPSAEGGGAEIVEVGPSSAAAMANLRAGDVITSIDGKPVSSPMELAAALRNHEPGSQIHVGYLFHASIGLYAKETVLILGPSK